MWKVRQAKGFVATAQWEIATTRSSRLTKDFLELIISSILTKAHSVCHLWTPSNGRWHFAAWIPDQYFPIPMAWVRKSWVPTGDENHVTNVAPWILRWTPAQKFLAFYFSLGGNLDKNNVRSFFCHVNAAVLSVISTKQDSWQFLKCLSLRYIPKRHFLPYIYIKNSMMTFTTYMLFDKIQF